MAGGYYESAHFGIFTDENSSFHVESNMVWLPYFELGRSFEYKHQERREKAGCRVSNLKII